MSITRRPDGLWFVDVEPIKGRRFHKRFKTKGEAQCFDVSVRAKLAVTPEWNPGQRTPAGCLSSSSAGRNCTGSDHQWAMS